MANPHYEYNIGHEEKLLEKLIFNNRLFIVVAFAALTIFFGFMASKLKPDASFTKMLPMEHPYIKAMMGHLDDLGAAGTSIQIAIENPNGDIFDKEFLEVVRQVNDELFYIKGVDRISLMSLWTPNVRWTAVTEEGFEGGEVIPSTYDGSEESMAQVKINIMRSGQMGRLVADNFKSTIVQANLYDRDPKTGEPLDYQKFAHELEEKVRDKYQSDKVKIHIVGFSKMIGDLMDGGREIAIFFGYSLVITGILLYAYTRSTRATAATLVVGLCAVVWQMGILVLLGYGLNAYSMLVPFLTFAMAISHSLQKISAMAVELKENTTPLEAARRAFLAIYIPGITALLADAIGFLTLLIIDIDVIKELAISASIGVSVLIFTNIVMLPVAVSFIGIEPKAVAKMKASSDTGKLWPLIARAATKPWARVILLLSFVGFVVSYIEAHKLQVGDLDKGAPELRADSRYNLDTVFVNENYAVSSDVMVIMVETGPQGCSRYENVEAIDRFAWEMENVPGVQSAISLAYVVKQVQSGYNEGNLKWMTVTRDQTALDSTFSQVPGQLMNTECSFAPVVLFLEDHKAGTLERVTAAAEAFAQKNNNENIRFVLATGNAGVEAATNEVIKEANRNMLYLIYAVVTVLVFLTFRSVISVICIMIPLGLTSILCEAIMTWMGMGVKVATLPVIAVGVGIGVDYGIYLYSRLEVYLEEGMPLYDAYLKTLQTTGKAVWYTGLMLAIGVATWNMSAIKFQADMGFLLTFMFLWNMIGALLMLPALAAYLIKPAEETTEGAQ